MASKKEKIPAPVDLKKIIVQRKKYKCEKCGYISTKTYLVTFEDNEERYCMKCTADFFRKNLPKVKLIEERIRD